MTGRTDSKNVREKARPYLLPEIQGAMPARLCMTGPQEDLEIKPLRCYTSRKCGFKARIVFLRPGGKEGLRV